MKRSIIFGLTMIAIFALTYVIKGCMFLDHYSESAEAQRKWPGWYVATIEPNKSVPIPGDFSPNYKIDRLSIAPSPDGSTLAVNILFTPKTKTAKIITLKLMILDIDARSIGTATFRIPAQPGSAQSPAFGSINLTKDQSDAIFVALQNDAP
jgi:hypothetical protein